MDMDFKLRDLRDDESTAVGVRSKNWKGGVDLDERIWQLLSDEHIDRIRAFLPPSSLFRFRCVCRRWNLLTADLGFLELYSQVAFSNPSVLVISHDNNHRVSAFFLESLTRWYKVPLDFLPEQACLPLATDGGLLCVGSFQASDCLYVCNPLTKSWLLLPGCQLRQVCKKVRKPLVNMTVDRSSRTYKVLVVCDPSHTNNLSTVVKIYDSRTGQWASFENRMPVKSNLASTSVVRDGVLYWCTLFPDGLYSYDHRRRVWSFQPIAFPRLFTPFGEAHLILLEGRSLGLIGLKVGGRNFAIGIWKLNEAGSAQDGSEQDEWEWQEMAWQSPPSFRRSQCEWSGLQGFGHENMVCLASRNTPNWVRYDLEQSSWFTGEPAPHPPPPAHGPPPYPRVLNHNWCFYEPRLNICA
ncbi:hypothetical protein MPTK1_1g17840 [Marchantia polymorpha subsp. ruderalis]|nr:hypothetical protein MARPO_0001s0123 [Marchantia polymorpha]BBM98994.1 hypothetical protein Mp_1g17840 [Marchantia polymorpha subsp. ruderalis]|eukprot:PTQ50070.1 hypothetical protein MARPO_0001s0123 [Marchantia polymorpha]